MTEGKVEEYKEILKKKGLSFHLLPQVRSNDWSDCVGIKINRDT